jgi:hypothetical protein
MMSDCPNESGDEHVNANYSVSGIIDTELRCKRRLLYVVISDFTTDDLDVSSLSTHYLIVTSLCCPVLASLCLA